jgi:aminopeptidase N
MYLKNLFLIPVILMLAFYPAKAQQRTIEKGISIQLAQQRVKTISDIRYNLTFSIPEELAESISGELILKIKLKNILNPLVLDFAVPTGNIQKVETLTGKNVSWKHVNGHLIIPVSYLKLGDNGFLIRFKAGEQSLNRNKEFLYTLFVPARASTAFPCFDQPDMKARFDLKLEIPSGWVATGNGKLKETTIKGNKAFYAFEPTAPISTYLFSFVAGKFKTIRKEHNGTAYTFFYRETDSLKMVRNTDSIFKQVFMSVDWMEKFTGIKQPFGKYDFIAVPSFQYGGMEHPGAILYNAQRLILDESATQEDELNRANLLAHETAHLWFGDLVTMKWFDDVWLKEVFANFMADKMVNPMYPGMNHQLMFLLAHQPRAYAVDRTLGANPIQQKLTNLAEAGSLYGNIIYHKAPVVMNQLENLMGAVSFQKGLQEYLKTFSFGNANWDDLIAILGKYSKKDLKSWSSAWVKEPGMPHYVVSYSQKGGQKNPATVKQSDPSGKNRVWPQELTITVQGKTDQLSQEIYANTTSFSTLPFTFKPLYILPNSLETGYGYFELDQGTTQYLLHNMDSLRDPLLRGTAWLSLHEMMISNKIGSLDYFNALCSALEVESEEQLINFLVSDIQMAFGKYLDATQKSTVFESLPALLGSKLNSAKTKSLKATYLKAYINTTQNSCIGMDTLYAIWSGRHQIPGLKLSDNDYRIIACELAVRDYPDAKKVLAAQVERIKDKDLKERLIYLLPSLSDSKEVRDNFFKELRNPVMREHEPWATEALGYLNHPLREEDSEGYILPGLNMLEEIRATGDIFFPLDWLNALLSGHTSPEAAKTVREFLKNHPNYPLDLRMKILQAADNLFRRNPLPEKE